MLGIYGMMGVEHVQSTKVGTISLAKLLICLGSHLSLHLTTRTREAVKVGGESFALIGFLEAEAPLELLQLPRKACDALHLDDRVRRE